MKIVIIHYTMPDVPGFVTKMFNGVLPILKEHVDVQARWVIHTEPDLATKSKSYSNIINMSNYKNAVEILKQEKPDLIYINPVTSIPDYAFGLAAKYLKIPVVGSELGNYLFEKKIGAASFIQPSAKQKSYFKNKIISFLNKYLFLVRTQTALGWNIFQIIKDFIFFINAFVPIFYKCEAHLPKFQVDRIFVQSDKTIQYLDRLGFDKSKLVSVGDPTYDEFFQLLETSKKSTIKKHKKNILIITALIFGESRRNALLQRKLFVQEVIKAIPNVEFEVVIKIHPTSENLEEYTDILESINSEINVTQNTNLVELILNADIIITPVSATAVVCGLIARKPIIIWNVFNVGNDVLIQNELALPCKDKKMILEQIRKAETWIPSEEKIEQFVREYLHASDGMASARTATEILNYLKKRSPHIF